VDNGKGVIIRTSEKVCGKEAIDARMEVFEQHNIVEREYHILDNLMCTEYDVTADEIEMISNIDLKAAQINPDIIMAVVESTFLRFSLTDIWQAHIENYILHSASFINQVDAFLWIKEILQDKNMVPEGVSA